jgi:hypothetical protein
MQTTLHSKQLRGNDDAKPLPRVYAVHAAHCDAARHDRGILPGLRRTAPTRRIPFGAAAGSWSITNPSWIYGAK